LLNASVNGTNLQVQATCLFAGTYWLIGTTNVNLPASQWTPLLTNAVYSRGTNNFVPALTNPLSAAPMQFYHICGK
jgi:hypothetical protein